MLASNLRAKKTYIPVVAEKEMRRAMVRVLRTEALSMNPGAAVDRQPEDFDPVPSMPVKPPRADAER